MTTRRDFIKKMAAGIVVGGALGSGILKPIEAMAKNNDDDCVQIVPEECLECGLCETECPFGAIEWTQIENPDINGDIYIETYQVNCDMCFHDECDRECYYACPVGDDAIIFPDNT